MMICACGSPECNSIIVVTDRKQKFVHLQVVVHLLLMLAGDVETNPGPGENTAHTGTIRIR